MGNSFLDTCIAETIRDDVHRGFESMGEIIQLMNDQEKEDFEKFLKPEYEKYIKGRLDEIDKKRL